MSSTGGLIGITSLLLASAALAIAPPSCPSMIIRWCGQANDVLDDVGCGSPPGVAMPGALVRQRKDWAVFESGMQSSPAKPSSVSAQCHNFHRTIDSHLDASCSGNESDTQRILKAAAAVCEFRSEDCQTETQPRFAIVMESMEKNQYGYVSVRDPYTIHLASNHKANTTLQDGLLVGSALAHELTHTRQLLAGRNKLNASCQELEGEAFREQDAFLAHYGYAFATGTATSRAQFDCDN
jgi:hypothetical protein